jgi:aminoglycoside 2'-N-acetyltransferase I
MEPTVEIKSVKNLSPEEQDEVYQLLTIVYEADISTWTWSQDDWRLLVRMNDRIVSHVAITERICLVDGQPVKVGGIGGVGTHPEWRKQGLASLAMRKTADFLVKTLKVDFGVLFCANELVPYYQRLGWRTIDSPVFFGEEGEKMPCDCPVMYLPGTKPYWPWGEVNIRGRLW